MTRHKRQGQLSLSYIYIYSYSYNESSDLIVRRKHIQGRTRYRLHIRISTSILAIRKSILCHCYSAKSAVFFAVFYKPFCFANCYIARKENLLVSNWIWWCKVRCRITSILTSYCRDLCWACRNTKQLWYCTGFFRRR